jgi:hypothetical protein
MQINGVKEFLSRFITPPKTVAGGLASPLLPVPSQQKNAFDILNLSDIGKRLSFKTEKAPLLEGTRKTNNSDPILSLMDKSMTEVEEILAKMHALAVSARDDKNLSDLDRINMQIEMEELRARLNDATEAMSTKLANMSGQERNKNQIIDPTPTLDGSTVLERARARIMRGEKWDVAEGFKYHLELGELMVVGEVGERSYKVQTGEHFTLPEDIDPEKNVLLALAQPNFDNSGEWYVADGEFMPDGNPVPTVSQILKESGTIVLMDAKSAAEGVKRLESELEAMKAMREAFTTFSKNYTPSTPQQTANTARLTQELVDSLKKSKVNGEEDGDDNKRIFSTALGVMEIEFVGGGDKKPKLIRPTTPTGEMFAKIDRFFDRISKNITQGWINDSGVLTGNVWTNADLTKKAAVAA